MFDAKMWSFWGVSPMTFPFRSIPCVRKALINVSSNRSIENAPFCELKWSSVASFNDGTIDESEKWSSNIAFIWLDFNPNATAVPTIAPTDDP
jgi:hypothetical protein